ncbi:alpha/beta hydrolase [Glaciecola sp. MH2013]|uniref:alpha/beta fold hydrolase n=1 Tax=Glaciecola sp. MH2013 TaxID=2785524 RepID=UPI00189D3794|nr:alpha/beta hydrolase [Glaciecola sp. MH2013]MBF7072950.1 alpha/beta hydrolase [Glaciecola sp. MH2013]
MDTTAKYKAMIHFAHANGFPAQSYRKLMTSIDPNFKLIALEKFAHNPRFPLNNNWANQVEELLDYLESEQQALQASLPVILVGHSFGAVISYLAACKCPSMFAGLIMLDPPLVTGAASWIFKFAKRNRLIDKITPAGKTNIRNKQWHHSDDLVEYFSQRALFRNMDPECIADYVDAVTSREGDHLHLTFSTDVEANIFRTLPDNLHQFSGQLQCPGFLVTGSETDVCIPSLRKRFLKANPTLEHEELTFGGHMFPLERPIELAQRLNVLLKEIVG